ncbi:glutamate-ammonia-ligase adenylyltransferase [Plasticicumulans lactativorans]|uniref:Bifunctional glutamine synthetase adenylyltransferase/adenylyl-removing enzyme n=1 Tax=Plasticicumulans lactativorans TaxID=1133106 RepID=A0A4R2LBF3_9GAMM|nr:bifunctional [glutamate--ammonia ligase]-adenylyl-L-tyrosine phosphorylase/[glutamate--ammonia-ligase] adenylyltransferase [Plasticicumulans lactativorans]TCO81625.1 glutamate-ammonia-ligase adenylyltransferase [Plasticicumulans lactativorans]
MTDFTAALAALPAALRPAVAAHWEAFTAAAAPPPAARLAELARVWAGSGFVAESCTRSPELLAGLLGSGDLDRAYAAGELRARLAAQAAGAADEAALMAALRRARRREMVRIAWRDLAGHATLAETLGDLTDLADAAVDLALERAHAWEAERCGEPRGADGTPQRLVVLGMGKLGGRELNFSSDIDLIFAYPENGETDGRRCIDNQSFFTRVGQRLIRLLDAPTGDGFVFRVDMRLRPFGDSGPLVASFNAFETYYQTQGREWERYAMIKARAMAGDLAAGERLLAALRPFVFRRYLDFGAFESLRGMKALIARQVERKGLRHNVKLGPGGIREVEFIGQAFQLIYGGREPGLRVRGILAVLDYLRDTERLPAYAVARLENAYGFLRRVENRLQAWADGQTHDLPEEATGRLRLAFAMGFADWEAFSAEYRERTRFVAGQFEQVFAAPQAEDAPSAPGRETTGAWASADADEARASLAGQGFDDPERAVAALARLRASFAYRSMRAEGQERLDRLMPLLLGAAAAVAQPAQALERIVRLLEPILRRSVYLALLIENPLALSQLVKLCAASEWIAEHLARYPLLLDELLDPSDLYAPLDRQQLRAELERLLAHVPAGDQEALLDALRHFKHSCVLRVAAADVSDVLPLMVVSDHLTDIAEVVLKKCVALAWNDLVARHGTPRCVDAGEARAAAFAVIAYGKLGGIELGYGSDLDLVFLHDSRGEAQETDGARALDNPSFFSKLASRIIHMLTAHTAGGALYEVDTRLRPSGRSGLLVASLDGYAEYERREAWTWEHQALVRARAVVGPAALVERFQALRQEILGRRRDPQALRREVREMRERMRQELGAHESGMFDLKQDRGGIADIEFMVQYLVLAHAADEPILARYTDNVRQLAALEATGLLSSWSAGLLRDTYRALRKRAHYLRLQGLPDRVRADEMREHTAAAARLWHALMEVD